MKILQHAAVEMQNDEALSYRFATIIQTLDLMFLGALLFNLRSRDWPPFYSFSLDDLRNVINLKVIK